MTLFFNLQIMFNHAKLGECDMKFYCAKSKSMLYISCNNCPNQHTCILCGSKILNGCFKIVLWILSFEYIVSCWLHKRQLTSEHVELIGWNMKFIVPNKTKRGIFPTITVKSMRLYSLRICKKSMGVSSLFHCSTGITLHEM